MDNNYTDTNEIRRREDMALEENVRNNMNSKNKQTNKQINLEVILGRGPIKLFYQ